MEIKHCCVSLLDVPDVLPFGFERLENNLMDILDGTDEMDGALIAFMTDLELEFNEDVYQLGQDMVGEKLYRRYMFEKGGFLEVAMERPCAVIAHFISLERGQTFAEALSRVVIGYVKGGLGDLLVGDIQVSFQEESQLSNFKLAELRKLRNV
jgi:hypothetical protein